MYRFNYARSVQEADCSQLSVHCLCVNCQAIIFSDATFSNQALYLAKFTFIYYSELTIFFNNQSSLLLIMSYVSTLFWYLGTINVFKKTLHLLLTLL